MILGVSGRPATGWTHRWTYRRADDQLNDWPRDGVRLDGARLAGYVSSYAPGAAWSPFATASPRPHLGGGPSEHMRNLVLVVDDDRAIRDSLRMVLEDEGYAVVEAGDGVEAMSVLRGYARPMVVLLDIMMPRMSGEDVLREVSRDAQLQTNHAFVVITANRHALSSAFQQQLVGMRIPILEKPPDIEDVIAHVARAEQRLPTVH